MANGAGTPRKISGEFVGASGFGPARGRLRTVVSASDPMVLGRFRFGRGRARKVCYSGDTKERRQVSNGVTDSNENFTEIVRGSCFLRGRPSNLLRTVVPTGEYMVFGRVNFGPREPGSPVTPLSGRAIQRL